eukprot:6192529-Pleurochrysis_carterae.AAC.1
MGRQSLCAPVRTSVYADKRGRVQLLALVLRDDARERERGGKGRESEGARARARVREREKREREGADRQRSNRRERALELQRSTAKAGRDGRLMRAEFKSRTRHPHRPHRHAVAKHVNRVQ